MNQNRQTIESLLSSWGRAQLQLPANHATSKSQVISSLPETSTPKIAPQNYRGIPWATLAFASLAIITLLINPQQLAPVSSTKSGSIPPSSFNGAVNTVRESDQKGAPYYYPNDSTPIADNREFIKTSYSATLRTRQVSKLVQQIQTTVRSSGGRVDSSSSSARWGYVSFAIPANQLAVFRDQIKDLVNVRFYTETTGAQNLLPQKQLLESQRRQIDATLQQLRDEQVRVRTEYNRAIASINTQIDGNSNQLANISARLEVTSDYNLRMELIRQQNILLAERQALEANLVNKRTAYASKTALLNTQIKNSEASLNANRGEDQQLIDNVATVQGTISLNWISIWEILELYSPINLIALIFIIAALIAYWWHRQRNNRYIDLAI